MYQGVIKMRLSELNGKEIVNLYDGERLGFIENCDLVIDEVDGKIIYLSVPQHSSFMLFGERNYRKVEWESIKKVGSDLIIIDIKDKIKKYDPKK